MLTHSTALTLHRSGSGAPDGASAQPSLMAPLVFERIAPPRWAYHIVSIDPREQEPLDEQQLTALGAEGWLLTGVFEQQRRLVYYFVREA